VISRSTGKKHERMQADNRFGLSYDTYCADVGSERCKNAFNYISYNCILRSNNAYDVFGRSVHTGQEIFLIGSEGSTGGTDSER